MKNSNSALNIGWLMGTLVFSFIAMRSYLLSGYDPTLFMYIALSIIMGSLYFHQNLAIKISRDDYFWFALLLFMVAPIYLYHFDTIPWQINTDEIAIMRTSQRFTQNPGMDILGPSDYLGFAAMIFYVFGKISTWLGGIDLYHYRLVHTLSGIAICAAAYGFFRQLVNKPWMAFILALWLASNHALFAISRMAMRDNTGLLIELVSLMLLAYGWKNRNHLLLFWGGVIGGLSFYTYFPSRITMIIWSIAAGLLILQNRSVWQESVKKLFISLFGFFLIVPYMLIATAKQQDLALAYSRQQFLFYPEGRLLQQQWVNATSALEGWITNIKNGLGTFNNHVHDLGYIYANFGHGFVDPLTGILLWVGLGVILWKVFKQGIGFNEILCLVGFGLLYLLFAFVITKAPNYTRLFTILPFVIYIAGQGLFAVLNGKNLGVKISVASVVLMIVVAWNALIFNDFVRVGKMQGQDVGNTARYVLARHNETGRTWMMVADKNYPYYSWGSEGGWLEWFGFFKGPTQNSTVVSIEELKTLNLNPSYTLLLSKHAWEFVKAEFVKIYASPKVDKITPDGNYLAVDV